MSRLGLFFIILLMVIGLAGFFVSTDFTINSPTKPVVIKESLVVTVVDPQLGSPTAKTIIIEFADFACPYCRDADIILKELAAKNPTTVRLVWKDFPNDAHNPLSSTLSYAGRCAQRVGKFETFRDWAFLNQENLSQDGLLAYLKTLGVSDVEACLKDPSIQAKVNYTIRQGTYLQIDGTPYLLINNKYYTGPITLEALSRLLNY